MPNATTRDLRISELPVLALGIFTHGADRQRLIGLMPMVSPADRRRPAVDRRSAQEKGLK